MSTNGFTFNGRSSADFFIVNAKSRAIAPPITPRLISVVGRPGAYDNGKEIGSRSFKIDVTLNAANQDDYLALKRDIAAWLVTDEPQALVFDDEPDKTYYARLEGDTNLTEIARFGEGTLKFLAADPMAYGPEQSQTILDPTNPANANNIVTNPGTADAFPVFRATMQQTTTFFVISNGDEYVQVGQPPQVTETPVDQNVDVLADDMSDVSQWVASGLATPDDGAIGGTMSSDGTLFFASSYEAGLVGSGKWHGPAVKRSLTSPIQDFQVDALVTIDTSGSPSQMGRVEIYFLDSSNAIIGKMSMVDFYAGVHDTWGDIDIRSGSNKHVLINTHGYKRGAWNNFNAGMVRLVRNGQHFHAYIAEIDPQTGEHNTRWNGWYYDKNNTFQTQLAQVEIHIGRAAGYDLPKRAFVHQLDVYQLNAVQTSEVPNLARAGDVIEIDHNLAKVTKNGEPIMTALDIDSDFFALKPGPNNIGMLPENGAVLSAAYNPRYL